MFDKNDLEDSDIFLHETSESETLDEIISDFYPNIKERFAKLKLFQAIICMNVHNGNLKGYTIQTKFKGKSWFLLPTAHSLIVKICAIKKTPFNSIYIIANGINQNFELLFENEENKKKFNLMVETIGLNETLASLYSTISSYQFYYPYHFPQIIEKCKEINCEIEKNQNRYFTEAKNLLTQEKLKNEIRENEKKQRQSFIDSKKIKNSDEVNMIDNVFNKLFHDKIDDEEEHWYEEAVNSTKDGIINEFYINTTDKVSQIFLPISNITSDLRTYRSKYENLIALEASYRNGKMKGQKYLNLKTKINGELRFAKSNVDKGYSDLNATIVNYFKKDLMNLAESNSKIALFKPYIEPNYAKQKAKVRKYKKTYPFKSGSFLLSIIFKTLKWMNFYISRGLSFWDINNRYNNINTNYLISKRNGDRQVIIESSGFLASAFIGYSAGKLGGAAGSALGFKMGFGICLVTPLMPLSPFCGFVGAVTGGFAGAIVGAGIGGAIGDWIGQGVGGFIDDISQSAKNFLMLWNMNKEKISAPIILENNK